MPTLTTNYSLQKPLVNDPTDEDQWGDELNEDMDDIDGLLRVGITVAPQASQTALFTADASISVKKLYPCDATSAGFTVTIPAAITAAAGATVFIKKTDSTSNIITLARSSTDTIDGATSLTLTAQNECYGLVSDGVSAWFSICRNSTPADASETVKGIAELATAAEVLAGTDAVRITTPAAFAGNKSLATNGYYKLPGGLIIQWGFDTQSGAGPFTVNLPTAFSTACYTVNINSTDATGAVYASLNASPGATSFQYRKSSSGTQTQYWTALGV